MLPCPALPRRVLPPPCPAMPITESAHVFRKCAFFAKCFVNVSAPNFIISWHEGGAKENAASHHIATRRIAAPQEAEKREKALRKLCKLSGCSTQSPHTAHSTQHAATHVHNTVMPALHYPNADPSSGSISGCICCSPVFR